MVTDAEIRHYFVDEAGDFTLFNKRGAKVVGQHGVSKTLMLGVAQGPDPKEAYHQLEELRRGLVGDPYFRGVPSMQPESGKTAICFHACKDVPEVRREVYRLLPKLGAKMFVAIRRKDRLAADAKTKYKITGQKISQNAIYDDLVKRSFKDLLHKNECRITFARRGKSDRQAALEQAIQRAKTNFKNKWGKDGEHPTNITSTVPSQSVGLQIVDYYLWAIQRLYEKGEDRYFEMLADQFRLVMDLDDQRNKGYGEWYNAKSKRLSLQKIKPVVG